MYRLIFILSFVSCQLVQASSLHLDPEMRVEEYQRHLRRNSSQKFIISKKDVAIEKAISLGERLSSWLEFINNVRTNQTSLKLTSSQNLGSPIEKPYVYSIKIVERKTKEVLESLPLHMRNILLGSGPFSIDLKMSDEDFIHHGRKVYGIYSMAARYKLLSPSRPYLQGQEKRDVRGYYYLNQNRITEKELNSTSSLSTSKYQDIMDALIKICQNDWNSRNSCQKKVEKAAKDKSLAEIYRTYYPIAQKNWESFFKIKKDSRRKDVQWGAVHTFIPFATPSSQHISNFIQSNIEEEYKFNGWSLVLQFSNYGPTLDFRKGVTAHVNKVGGNQIIMDANSPLDEFDSQWTIKHEFGHVLGLPDCYHEFYDSKLQAYVNYQLDTTDLMCSRGGKMNARIFEELERSYR